MPRKKTPDKYDISPWMQRFSGGSDGPSSKQHAKPSILLDELKQEATAWENRQPATIKESIEFQGLQKQIEQLDSETLRGYWRKSIFEPILALSCSRIISNQESQDWNEIAVNNVKLNLCLLSPATQEQRSRIRIARYLCQYWGVTAPVHWLKELIFYECYYNFDDKQTAQAKANDDTKLIQNMRVLGTEQTIVTVRAESQLNIGKGIKSEDLAAAFLNEHSAASVQYMRQTVKLATGRAWPLKPNQGHHLCSFIPSLADCVCLDIDISEITTWLEHEQQK